MDDNSGGLFNSAKLKLQWANRHARLLAECFDNYWKKNPVSLYIDPDHENSQKNIRVMMEPFPNTWPFIIGDTIHNFRSALDHLAIDALKLNCGNNVSRTAISETYFPICASEEDFLGNSAQNKFKRLSESHQNIIRELKPYVGGNDTLWALHKLDIRDKHLMIIPAAAALTDNFSEGRIYLSDDGSVIGPSTVEIQFGASTIFPLKNGDILASYPIDQPDENVAPQANINIVFGQGQHCEGEAILEVIDKMGEVVSSILRQFEAGVT